MLLVALALSAALIRPIENQSATERCGCKFSRNDKAIFFSECNGRPALMNIGGRDVWLDLATPEDDDDWGNEVGYRSVVKYKGHGVTTRIARTVTYVCPPKQECEYVDMKATITVTRGAERQTIRVKGSCGC